MVAQYRAWLQYLIILHTHVIIGQISKRLLQRGSRICLSETQRQKQVLDDQELKNAPECSCYCHSVTMFPVLKTLYAQAILTSSR